MIINHHKFLSFVGYYTAVADIWATVWEYFPQHCILFNLALPAISHYERFFKKIQVRFY